MVNGGQGEHDKMMEDAMEMLKILPLEHEFEAAAGDKGLTDPVKAENLKAIVDRMNAHWQELLEKGGSMGAYAALSGAAFLRQDDMLCGYLKDAFEKMDVPAGCVYLNPYKADLLRHMEETAAALEKRAYRFLPDADFRP